MLEPDRPAGLNPCPYCGQVIQGTKREIAKHLWAHPEFKQKALAKAQAKAAERLVAWKAKQKVEH